MDIKDAKILWNRAGYPDHPTTVKVVSIKQPETISEEKILCSYGACNIEWVEATKKDRIILMLKLFVEIVATQGVNAIDAYDEFSKIEQFKHLFSHEY